MRSVAALTVLGRYGSHPAPGGAGRGYLLTGGPRAVLLGCGSGVAGRLGYALGGPEELGALVLPDLRPDHGSDLWSIGSMAAAAVEAGRRRGLLPVYAYGRPEGGWQGLHRPGVLDVRRFAPGDTVRLEGWTLSFAPLEHAWPGVAVRAEGPGGPLALVGLGRPTETVRTLCAGARLAVIEVGGPHVDDEGLDGGMSAAEAGRLALEAGVGRLLLAHLDPSTKPEELLWEAQAGFPPAALALEGRTYGLGAEGEDAVANPPGAGTSSRRSEG